MKISKKYLSSDDFLEEYEIYIGEAYDEQNDIELDDVYLYSNGYKKQKYWFNSFEECIDFIQQKEPKTVYQYFCNKKEILNKLQSISITRDHIQRCIAADAYLKSSPELIRDLYYTYGNHYNFWHFFTKENINNSERKYFVYNWHTVPDKKIFYVNASSESTELVSLHYYKNEDLELMKRLKNISSEIVASDLTFIEKEIAIRGMIYRYSDQNEFILSTSAYNYRLEKETHSNSIYDADYQAETVNFYFCKDGLYTHYLTDIYTDPYCDNLECDENWRETLGNCYLAGRGVNKNVENSLKKINVKIDKSILKRTKSVVICDRIKMKDYITFRDAGLKIYCLRNIMNCIHNTPVQKEPEIQVDVAIHPINNRCPLNEVKNILDENKGYELGFKFYSKGETLRKNGEYKKAIDMFDKARAVGYQAPVLYSSYLKTYKKLGDIENEIDILQEELDRILLRHRADLNWQNTIEEKRMEIQKYKKELIESKKSCN